MIFALAKQQPFLFLMLTDQDVNNMRGGRTVFVDQRQLTGATFEGVILSLHRNNDEALALAKRFAVGEVPEPTPPQPLGGEAKCSGCDGIMSFASLLAGKCAVCWKEKAEVLEKMLADAGRGL